MQDTEPTNLTDPKFLAHLDRAYAEYNWCPDGEDGHCDFCRELNLLQSAAREIRRLNALLAEVVQ